MRLWVPSEEKTYGDPPMLSFHGDPIPELQKTFFDGNKPVPPLNVHCWEALHISGYQLTFKDGDKCVILQSTKTKKKRSSWCCEELKMICTDKRFSELVEVTLKEEDNISEKSLSILLEDTRFLVATFNQLFLEGSETYGPKITRAKYKKQKKAKAKTPIPDGIVRKFGAKDLFICVRSACGSGLRLPIKGLPTPPENTTTFESVALFLHMLSYLTEGAVERSGLTISLAVRGRNLPPARLVIESDTPPTMSAENGPRPVVQLESEGHVTLQVEEHGSDPPVAENSSNSTDSSTETSVNSDQTSNLEGQTETKLTIYCMDMSPDHVGCLPCAPRELSTIALMVLMLFFYLLCFASFYSELMEKFRSNMNSTNTNATSCNTNNSQFIFSFY